MLYDHILIDGRHMLYRVASTHRALGIETFDGTIPTGAIYGFIKTTLGVYEQHAAEGCQIVIAWEGGYTHRRQLFEGYKRNRTKRRDDPDHKEFILTLNDQEQVLKSLMARMGWGQAWAKHYEADDVMATLARQLDGNIAIYTGDHDLHQCVNERVHVITPVRVAHRKDGAREKIWDVSAVRDHWKVAPSRIPEVKALAGDASDCIPGAQGIGEVWARKLLTAYTLDKLMAASHGGELKGRYDGEDWTSKRHATLVQKSRGKVWVSLDLAMVIDNVPVTPIPTTKDRTKMIEAFRAFQFKTLLRPTVLAAIDSMGEGNAGG